MAGFHGCKWCQGRGCLACGEEKRVWEQKTFGQPMFTARTDNEKEMAELRAIFSAPALEESFGPDGGGMAEVEEKAAMTMLKRELRKAFTGESE